MIPGPNWARRYRTHHRRLCARPGCEVPAAATLRFHSTRREACLVDLDDTLPRAQGDLCVRHVGALVLPRGWALHDERTTAVVDAPVLVVVAETPPEHAEVPAELAALPRIPPQIGSIDVVPDDEVADELADVLDARTPLLQRAFQNSLPR